MLRATLLLLAAPSALATLAYCNDKDTSCANWAKEGMCEGDNGEVVKDKWVERAAQ